MFLPHQTELHRFERHGTHAFEQWRPELRARAPLPALGSDRAGQKFQATRVGQYRADHGDSLRQGTMHLWHPQNVWISGPPPLLSIFGTDLQYRIHATFIFLFLCTPSPSKCGRHMWMISKAYCNIPPKGFLEGNWCNPKNNITGAGFKVSFSRVLWLITNCDIYSIQLML